MGSLEAYLVALLIPVSGTSIWALRMETILLSLVTVWLTWRMATAFADAARLSPTNKQLFRTISAFLAALPPLYDTVLQLRTLGGYIEIFVLMLLLLLSTFQFIRRWRKGASWYELALRYAGIGFIIGLGLWIDPLIISAITVSILWISGHFITHIFRRCVGRSHSAPGSLLQGLLLSVFVLPAATIGFLPAIYWGKHHNWANIHYLLESGQTLSTDPTMQAEYPDRFSLFNATAHFYNSYIAPRIIGGTLPTENHLSAMIHLCTLLMGLFCIIAPLLMLILSFFRRDPLLLRVRFLAALPLLFAFCTALIFCASPISTGGLFSYQNDVVGRYATPFMLVFPFLIATTFTIMRIWLYEIWQGDNVETRLVTRRGGSGVEWGGDPCGRPSSLSSPNDSCIPHSGRPQGSPPLLSTTPAPTGLRPYLPLSLKLSQLILIILFFVFLRLQSFSYELTDSGATFQSPSCPMAMANTDPVITYLEQEHVHYAWGISWLGNPITFKTNERIIVADPRVVIAYNFLNRMPAYPRLVQHAARPAMLAFIAHSDSYPLLLQLLDKRHVTYHVKRFSSEPGTDVLAVTSLSRTVSLYESQRFGEVFHNCI